MKASLPTLLRKMRSSITGNGVYLRNTEIAAWKRCIPNLSHYQASDFPRRVFIVPSDPWTLRGAKGDEAMMEAAIGRIRRKSPTVEVAVLTATTNASNLAQEMGFRPFLVWKSKFSYADIVSALEDFKPDITLVLGADVMDGYYSAVNSTRALLTADLSARLGARVSILGFSFNRHPAKGLAQIFPLLHHGVHLNLRDRISFDRFKSFTGISPNFVADVAFLLDPARDTPSVAEIDTWIRARKSSGRKVIGFNVHPMLFRDMSSDQTASIVSAARRALSKVYEKRSVAFLLISHDSRKSHGDEICLEPLVDQLTELMGENVRFTSSALSAAQIKAVSGSLDGVVTARMHLAIAALGQAVPVAAITYQDKFQGLFQHFDLDSAYAMSPTDFLIEGKLDDMMLRFIDQLTALRLLTEERLPEVMRRAEGNFAGIIVDTETN